MNKEQAIAIRDMHNIENLEFQIRDNQFQSKEQLIKYLTNIGNNGYNQLDNNQIEELLNLFDSLHKTEKALLDMQKYANVELEGQNFTVSKESNQVLKNLGDSSEFTTEFQQIQNELVADNQDGMVNADTVFEHMTTYKKEEISLIPISEAISKDDIEIEILNKIKFFITNSFINYHSFKVDIQSGMFYNIETDEIYEVRKNTNTNQYEIYRSSEKVYGSNMEQPLEDKDESELDKEQDGIPQVRNLPKVRVRKKTLPQIMGNGAFTKIGLLVVNIITFTLLIAMIILLNK